MLTSNVGDMVQAMMLRRQSASASAELNRLSQEMASGRVSDLQDHFRGNFAPMAGLERALATNAAYKASNTAAGQFAAAQQAALEAAQSTAGAAATRFLNTTPTGDVTQLRIVYTNAAEDLEQVVSALNGRQAGRALFAGAATQGTAVADAAQILADLGAALAGQTTAAGALAAADAFFDTPGGGFDTLVYTGSTTPLAAFDTGEGRSETLSTTAQDPALRDTLKGLAVVALMGQGLLSASTTEQHALLQAAGSRLLNTNDDLTGLRAGIGFAEERIETARVRGEAEATGLEAALGVLINADPYETALRLQEAETRVATIYTITARISSLSLVAVLR